LKKPERELIQQERKRSRKPKKAKSETGSIGGFGILGRSLVVGGPLALVALVLATFVTPLLAIENISVSGTDRIPGATIEKSLRGLISRPLTTVSQTEITELLADFALIETFAIQAVLPHTLEIKIRERQPIVVINKSGKNFLYDPAGVRIAEMDEKDKYPYLSIGTNDSDSPQFKTAVKVLLSLPLANYERVFSIEVSSSLTTTLILRTSNIRVIWGGVNNPLLKAEVLDSLIATKLDKGVQIDLTSPNSPVVTYPR
jgi:cell division protein FtsQ